MHSHLPSVRTHTPQPSARHRGPVRGADEALVVLLVLLRVVIFSDPTDIPNIPDRWSEQVAAAYVAVIDVASRRTLRRLVGPP